MLRTFIVEDSPVILENLVATLEELAGVEVVGHAADEAQALAWLDREGEGASLMIVDLILGRGSGLAVLHAAQRLQRPPHRVVLTNYATPEIRRHCLALGAERVFDKSHELEELIAHCAALAGVGAAREAA